MSALEIGGLKALAWDVLKDRAESALERALLRLVYIYIFVYMEAVYRGLVYRAPRYIEP